MSIAHVWLLKFFFVAGIVLFFLVVRFVCTLDRISTKDERRIEREAAGCEDAQEEDWRARRFL